MSVDRNGEELGIVRIALACPSFVQCQVVGSLKQKSTKLGHTVRVAAKWKARTQSQNARSGWERIHRAQNAPQVLPGGFGVGSRDWSN